MRASPRRNPGPGVAAGAAALAAAGLGAKALSSVARILVPRWLGAETVGLVEMAAPVLTTGLSLCGLGLPVAAAALGAAARGRGERRRAAELASATRWLLVVAGGAATIAVLVHAAFLARLLGNPAAAGALRATAPAILFATLLAGEKATLQAAGRVPASAWALAVEQGARVAVSLWVAVAWAGVAAAAAPRAAGALALAPAAGAAAGLAFCAALSGLAHMGERLPWRATGAGLPPLPEPLPSSTRPAVPPVLPVPEGEGGPGGAIPPWLDLLRAGLPNWASGAVASLTSGIDVPLITWRLRDAGLDAYSATAALGRLNGMAMPLAAGPAVVFGAVGSALVPATASDWARGDRDAVRRRARDAYFWVLAGAAPASFALWQLAGPLSQLLYRTSAPAEPLAVLAAIGLPLGLSYVAAAVANAVGRPSALLPGVFAGALLKSGLVLALTRPLGIRGSAMGSLAGFLLTASINLWVVWRLTGCRPPVVGWAAAALPALLADGLAAAGVWHALAASGLPLRLPAAGLAGAAAYGLCFLGGWALLRTRLGLPERVPLLSGRFGRHAPGPRVGA